MNNDQSAVAVPQPASVVRRLDATSFTEGPEHCREYLRNEHLWFGTSVVPVVIVWAGGPGEVSGS